MTGGARATDASERYSFVGEPLIGFHGVLRGTPVMTNDRPTDARVADSRMQAE